MGRLFWKFFISILLAQVAATLGIGGAFWLLDQSRARGNAPVIDTGPPAEFLVDAAAATLKHGGSAALADLLAQPHQRTVLAITENNQDLLGRGVDAAMLAQARNMLNTDGAPRVVRQVDAADGHRYVLFAPWEPHGPGGPGGPPPGWRAPPQDGSAKSTQPLASSAHTGDAGSPQRRPPPPPPDSHLHFVPLAAATIASLLVAVLLAWYFARPIRALRGAFEAAAAGDLSPRFASAARGDELSELGHDFDRMSRQLRAAMDNQRRLLHDVSHELRSPLARMQAAIGLAHQQPEKVASSLERIERESVRMDRLVGELLTLARLDAAPALPIHERVDLTELVSDIVHDAQFESPDSVMAIDDDGTDLAVLGAPDLLWRAIENLVRNALKYGAAGGAVDVKLSGEDGVVRISVLDRGPGIPESELAAVFQPFYRGQVSAGDVDGHGLGLAIALRVVQAHGGTLVARKRCGGGLCMDISLPRAP
ncbi:MAG: HAMP domain-containing sensor histidine kinase [Pseudomonadota bacterium]